MYEEPELIKAMLDRYCQASYEIYERMYEAANNKIDLIRCCDDYGTQISTLFSPGMWDEFLPKTQNVRRAGAPPRRILHAAFLRRCPQHHSQSG